MQLTLHGNPVNTCGKIVGNGEKLPDFTLVDKGLKDVTLADLTAPFLVLNIFPSVDTGTCAASVRRFNQEAAALDNATVLCISADLPFAQLRFCGAEGLERVITLSAFRSSFGRDYGVALADGPLKELLARVVIVANEERRVIYAQAVGEIADEPDYQGALAAIKAKNSLIF